MPVKRVATKEANELIQKGWAYLDVRSIPEYQAGHPVGAYNVPVLHLGPRGMTPNPEFFAVVAKVFPDKTTPIVCGCKSGGRSLHAAQALTAAGYSSVVDMRGGWSGDGVEPGWAQAGLPVERETPGRSFQELKK